MKSWLVSIFQVVAAVISAALSRKPAEAEKPAAAPPVPGFPAIRKDEQERLAREKMAVDRDADDARDADEDK